MPRKHAVKHAVAMGLCGIKRAQRVPGVARSTCQRRGEVNALRQASADLLIEVSHEHPEPGARKVARILRLEHEEMVNHQEAARVRAAHGMRAARRRRKRRYKADGIRVRHQAQRVDEVWSYDFTEGATADGRKIRLLSILNEHTRECLHLKAARSFPAARVIDS